MNQVDIIMPERCFAEANTPGLVLHQREATTEEHYILQTDEPLTVLRVALELSDIRRCSKILIRKGIPSAILFNPYKSKNIHWHVVVYTSTGDICICVKEQQPLPTTLRQQLPAMHNQLVYFKKHQLKHVTDDTPQYVTYNPFGHSYG